MYTFTLDRNSAEVPPRLVLASGQGNGIPGVAEVCAPRPGSKKLHVRLLQLTPSLLLNGVGILKVSGCGLAYYHGNSVYEN